MFNIVITTPATCQLLSGQEGTLLSLQTILLYYCRASIKSKDNDKVLLRLLKEVKGLNPTFDGADIRGAF